MHTRGSLQSLEIHSWCSFRFSRPPRHPLCWTLFVVLTLCADATIVHVHTDTILFHTKLALTHFTFPVGQPYTRKFKPCRIYTMPCAANEFGDILPDTFLWRHYHHLDALVVNQHQNRVLITRSPRVWSGNLQMASRTYLLIGQLLLVRLLLPYRCNYVHLPV